MMHCPFCYERPEMRPGPGTMWTCNACGAVANLVATAAAAQLCEHLLDAEDIAEAVRDAVAGWKPSLWCAGTETEEAEE